MTPWIVADQAPLSMDIRTHIHICIMYVHIYIYLIYAQHKCGILCTLNNDLWVTGVYPCALSSLLPEGGAGAHALEGQVLMAPRT